jgi:hypothetical protein
MSSAPWHKVTLGTKAWTLLYEDPLGTILFTFEISPAEIRRSGRSKLFLGKLPLTGDGKLMDCSNAIDRERVDLAIESVKEYLLSRGYVVEIR